MRFAIFFALLVALQAGPGRAEEGYLRPLGPAVVRADTAALLLSGQSGGTIRLAVLAVPHPASPSARGVNATVLVEIDGSSLLAGHVGPVLRADVFVYVIGPEKETVAHATQRLAVDLGLYRERLLRAGLKVALGLAVPPGEHQVRVLVRRVPLGGSRGETAGRTGNLGLSGAELAVADPETGDPGLLPPIVVTLPGNWLTVLSAADEAALALAWSWLGGDAFAAASRPVLTAGEARDVVLVGADSSSSRPTVLLQSADGEVREVKLDAVEPLAGAPSGIAAYRAKLPVAEVEPGVYRLAAALGDLRSPSIPALVVPASEEAEQLWTEVDPSREDRGIELPPPRAEGAAPESAVPDREVVAGYLGVLRQLAAGDRAAALRSLYELETRALARLESSAFEELERAQSETLAALLNDAWPGLLPVVLLHAEAVRGYRAAGRAALVGHAERMALRLVLSYAERVPGEAARRDAVVILAGLADALRRGGAVARAEELYHRARELAPGDEAVVLALAAIHERLGRFAQAVGVLETLPWSRLSEESRLRLALNLLRSRRGDKAERLLRRLADRGRVDWVCVVAFQELAKIELERDAGRAAETLHRALRRWPDHPALRLQLAYALDRLERPEEAAELLEAIGGEAAAEAMSERFRYNDWPRTTLEAERRALADRASERLAVLGSALGAFEKAEKD